MPAQLVPPDLILEDRHQHHPHAKGAEEDRKTHIEVCVRLRPILVQKESSSSFFSNDDEQHRQLQQQQQQQQQQQHRLNTPPRDHVHSNTASAVLGSSSRRVRSSVSALERRLARSRLRKPQIPSRGAAAAPPRPENPPPPPSSSYAPEESGNIICAWDVVGPDVVRQSPHTDIVPGRTHTYTLDRVYGPETTTSQLYDGSCRDLVHAAMDGYHTSILAYGQTSTGKTHTMTGTPKAPGLVPLCVRECFNYLEESDQPREYLLRISYLEVYKEHIRDLLATSAAAPPVRLFDSAREGLVIKGLREEVVTCADEVFQFLSQGEARRQVGATHMNQHSSRSHVMVRLWIESRLCNGSKATRVSSLSLVDLAGSESVRLSGSNDRRQEGHYINKSLMALGQVVYALSETKDNNGGSGILKKHVPYRDSKLTRLLQPSLSGNAQMVLICCISPMVTHIEESHNTFKFATRAKKIPQKATIQESAVDDKTLLQSYRDEIEDLRQQLKEAQEQQKRLLKDPAAAGNNNKNGGGGLFGVFNPLGSLSAPTAAEEEVTNEEEINELVEAIQTMEKLILKTNTPARQQQQQREKRPEEDLFDVDGDDSSNWEPLVEENNNRDNYSTPVPRRRGGGGGGGGRGGGTTDDDDDPRMMMSADQSSQIQSELSRIQGLLGSVLKKRMTNRETAEEEVRNLRTELEAQEVTTSLRIADSSFLQKQLQEKDDLLREVSKILEVVEERQTQLEAENAALRAEVERLSQYAEF